MTIEHLLRRCLAETDPPPGFADRVMARVRHERVAAPARAANPAAPSPRALVRVGPALAASLLLLLLGGVGLVQQQRRAAGERARAQLLEALRITHHSLETVQHTVAEAIGPGANP